jgi:DNA-binding Lrp family transcriptional regulator
LKKLSKSVRKIIELKGERWVVSCFFVHIRCRPGTTYDVAAKIALREIHSELYSISGDYDLLMKLYLPEGEDLGLFMNDNVLKIDGIERTHTTQTFKAF